MPGGIFVLNGDDLVEMSEAEYDSEAVRQTLLERYPNLLAGDQVDPVAPRRWLLIEGEMGVPDQEQGSTRWAVDHLFIDQNAVPTIVEVKRSTDTRIRREVVGQMLDYAANGLAYWPVEDPRGTPKPAFNRNACSASVGICNPYSHRRALSTGTLASRRPRLAREHLPLYLPTMAGAVYIESSVVSYLAARSSRDLITAGRQAITSDWWQNQRRSFDDERSDR